MRNVLVNESNIKSFHFMNSYVECLRRELGIPLTLLVDRPYLYLDDYEKSFRPFLPPTGAYALISCGYKHDALCKFAGKNIYQDVVDHYRGRIQFVQVGQSKDCQFPLSGVVNLIDKTNNRELLQLAYHSQFGLGGVTFLHHVYAAFSKPYICVLGGRENYTWEHYRTNITLHTIGSLNCCISGGCWRGNDCLTLGEYKSETIPKCMEIIGSYGIIRAIDSLYV